MEEVELGTPEEGSCSSGGSSGSRKPKSSSKSGKIKSRTSKGRSKRLRGRADDGATPAKMVAVVAGVVKVALDLVLTACRGREQRRAARASAAKLAKTSWQTAKREPVYVLKMWTLFLATLVAALWVTSAAGFDVWPSQSSPGLRLFMMSSDVAPATAVITDEIAEEDGIPMPADPIKKRMTKKLEIQFACDEVDCIEKCAHKVTKKCSASDGCMKARATLCKKKCRKMRCETRCKFEPQIGYVEREMKLDKCKDDCGSNGGPKCIDKCEKEFQTCKSRCAERRKKFVCDRVPNIAFPGAQATDDDDDDDGIDAGEGEAGHAVEDEEI